MIITILNIVLSLSALFYLSYLIHLHFGLRRLKPPPLKTDNNLPNLSIIVVAKDEEKNIENTVRSLNKQDYPDDRYEIIVVNDRSSDRTGEILKILQNEIKNLTILDIQHVPTDISPKKYALQQAVSITKTDFIATTDADCIHHSNWLKSYASLINPELGVATGITKFEKMKYGSSFERIWQDMQNIEYLSQQIVAAGAIGHNIGFSANGSNLFFNKSLYTICDSDAIKNNIISGDDFFLIQSAYKYGFRLQYNTDQSSVVLTPPADTIVELINQRARWGSKVPKSHSRLLWFAINTFLFYLGLTLYPLILIFRWEMLPFFLALFAVKAISDFAYVIHGFRKFKLSLNISHYLLLQILHAPFIITCVLTGTVFGFKWKGQNYKIDSKK